MDEPAASVPEQQQPPPPAPTPSRPDFPVVGIGASAGGLDALTRFFEHMPSDSGIAFVVVLHLSPRHQSDMATLLQSTTGMPVMQVTEGVAIEPNHVYVIPPTKDLAMNDGHLLLSEARRPPGRHVVIDLFFRTLAEAHRERAVGIVLSGTGSDGAVGITRLKEKGGITFAQSPVDAEFDGMPNAALATGAIDWTLPAADIPAKLVELWENARRIELPPGAEEIETEVVAAGAPRRQAEEALHDIMVTLRMRTGHDFRHYKRATVLRRLERRLQVNGVPNLPAYRELLDRNEAEAQALLKDLLIGVTNFFRDRTAFEALEREVLPSLFDPAAARETVRAWVAGCASGEEAYSMTMLLAEQAGGRTQVQVFATDIDDEALAVGRAGIYPASIIADVPPTRLRQFFNREDDRYRVRKDVREKILFTVHNLLRDPPFSRLDLVSCRNLLIYLDREVQEEILQMFHFALQPGGYLFLGSSESADAAPTLFSAIDKKHRIYRASAAPGARRVPTLPMGAAYPKPFLHSERGAKGERPPNRTSYADVHRQLVDRFTPPSVLVDADSNIVYLSEQAGRFLQHNAGPPSHNLLAVVRPELRIELRMALFQAAQSGKSVEARRVRLTMDDGKVCQVTMTARPAPPSALGALTLVMFDAIEDPLAGTESQSADGERDPLVVQLEAELQRTDAQLQLTIEHSETSNEELRASNEELQAINEELRSATEELETSKEEMQAVNEELITVNHELKAKIDETAKINDDLQNLIASTDIATVFVDRAMRIKRYTPRTAQIFNILPSDVGRSLLDITHRLTTNTLADDAVQAFETLRPVEREVRDQGGRWYLARALPYRTAEDRIDGAVLTFVDVTARREAEQRIGAEEQHLRLVVDSMRDYAIITFDTEGRVTSWSSGAERIFGFSRAQALGQPNETIFTPEDRAAGAPEEEMRQAREEGRAEDDRWHLRSDGKRVFCSGIMTPLREDGELRGYAKIARDLTGSRRTEREREALLRKEAAARAEAIAAGELKDEFLAVMSHELKNPLNLIHLNAELLARLPEAKGVPTVGRAAEVIRKAVLSQAQIIDDLLDLSRVNTGKLALAREAVDWGAIVTTIVGAMADEAVQRQVALAADLPPEPVVVEADPVRVEQIVWNLLSNALKFTPAEGEVSVRLCAEGGFGVLEVRDNGRGIDPSQLPRLFGMFQQAAGGAVSRRERGLGIGLAIVSQLAKLQGGRVEGQSEGLGKGSTFTVRLPLHGAAGREVVRATAQADGALPANLRVLVVDDDRENTETLAELLRLDGIGAASAFSAEEALEAIEHEEFDVIVSDIAMPDTDGYTFIAALRRNPRTSTVPVIALTGLGRASDVRRAAEAGFDAHLTKPATAERLMATLRRVLRGKMAAAPLPELEPGLAGTGGGGNTTGSGGG